MESVDSYQFRSLLGRQLSIIDQQMGIVDQQKNFLFNVALGTAMSVPFMFSSNTVVLSLGYAMVSAPLYFCDAAPAPFLGLGIGLVGRACRNISPFVDFAKGGSSFISSFRPLISKAFWKPTAQFLLGTMMAKAAIDFETKKKSD